MWKHDHFGLNTDFLFDIQVKRLHEYKRQLLNAFSILDIYFGLKDGRIKDFYPTTFLFGAKAAPGYYRAKGIIKFINEVANLVNYDDEVNRKMQVIFVQDYNVSYAEKLIPAADVSEQISTAGTEASGTSNMKFMLNGAVTLGTLDGANIEIVDRAGRENNYIFGATVEEINAAKASYDPRKLYESEPRIKRVVDTLIDGTVSDGGTGMFRELYDALLKGASWHQPDHYFLLLDFLPYCEARLKANHDYANRDEFARKCLMNIANAGEFSSDRTIRPLLIWRIYAFSKYTRKAERGKRITLTEKRGISDSPKTDTGNYKKLLRFHRNWSILQRGTRNLQRRLSCMTIAEVSRKYDISPDTLRYYERIGLIPPVPRNKSGIRDYGEESCNWIELMKCMRQAGVQIEALIEYVALFQQGDSTIGARKALLIEQRNQLLRRMQAMQESLDRLNYKIQNYERSIVPAEQRLQRASVPEQAETA